jgi:ABC-2 type transport system permease protein
MYTAAQGRTTGPSQAGIPWPAYFMVSMAAFAAVGAGLAGAPLIAADRSGGWLRQLRAMPFPPLAYLAAKILTSFLTLVPALLLVMVGAVVMAGVSLPVMTWLELILVLALGAIPFVGLGVLAGYLLDERASTGGILIAYIGLAILGGLWMPASLFSGMLLALAKLLPSHHLANLGWSVLAGTGVDLGSVTGLAVYTVVFGGLVLWRYRAEPNRTAVA